MSIKIQKILVFIPCVNLITLFCWFALCFKTQIRWIDYMKDCLKMFLVAAIITLIRIVCVMFISNDFIRSVLFLVWAYCFFSAIAWYAVRIQEKMIEQSKKE